MKRSLCLLAALALVAGGGRAATPLFVTADVPTTVSVGPTLLPWEIWRYDTGPVYSLQLTVPGDPHIGAIHKLNAPIDWLFSVESPSNLGGAFPPGAQPADVVRYDSSSGTYSPFFCGTALGIAGGTRIDGLSLEGGDAGNLIVSFDVPTELPAGSGTFFDPSDLVRFEPTGGLGCAAWTLSGLNPAFDASAAGAGIPLADNVIGAEVRGGMAVLALDVPSDLAPSLGPPTYVPGQIASWDGVNFDLFEPLVGWPAGSLVDGLACQADPGRITAASPATQIQMNKALPPDVVILWPGSCSSGADDYGIYEGTLASVRMGIYDHVSIDCSDGVPLLQETITPAVVNTYYLVVPYNLKDEGSYGLSTAGERPQAAAIPDRCVEIQSLIACP